MNCIASRESNNRVLAAYGADCAAPARFSSRRANKARSNKRTVIGGALVKPSSSIQPLSFYSIPSAIEFCPLHSQCFLSVNIYTTTFALSSIGLFSAAKHELYSRSPLRVLLKACMFAQRLGSSHNMIRITNHYIFIFSSLQIRTRLR